jgi:Fur family transcriptional regulator, ferric uptake regulator
VPPSPRKPRVDLGRVLREAGLRRTAPRVAVLERLEGGKAPLSHGDIAEALGPRGFDRATVYRNLMDLVGAGLVTRTDLGDHVWRFERVRPGDASHATEHPHFVCTDCGGVSCLPDETVQIVPGRGAPRAIRKHEVAVQVKGLCDACQG